MAPNTQPEMYWHMFSTQCGGYLATSGQLECREGGIRGRTLSSVILSHAGRIYLSDFVFSLLSFFYKGAFCDQRYLEALANLCQRCKNDGLKCVCNTALVTQYSCELENRTPETFLGQDVSKFLVPGGFTLVSGTGGVRYCSEFVDYRNR